MLKFPGQSDNRYQIQATLQGQLKILFKMQIIMYHVFV